LEIDEFVAGQGGGHELVEPVVRAHVTGGVHEVIQAGAVIGDEVAPALGIFLGAGLEPLAEVRLLLGRQIVFPRQFAGHGFDPFLLIADADAVE